MPKIKDIENLSDVERGAYLNRFEIEWMQKNIDFIKGLIKSHSLIPKQLVLEVGGLVYACKGLDDDLRVNLANVLANKLVEDAKERIPHIEYIMNDSISWNWLNQAGWLIEKNKADAEDFLAQQKDLAQKGMRKYIKPNTYPDWKIIELIDELKKKDIEKESDHRDIIYYIFKACEYEQYARTSDNVSESQQKEAVRKRIQNAYNSPYPKQPTIFRIWKKKNPNLAF